MTFTTSNWNAPQTVTVTGVNDDVDNGASRSATITNTPSGAGYSNSVTVTDDEAEPTLSISGGEATEGNTGTTPLRFTVAKSGDTDQVVTVAYASSGGTATPGTDFTNVSGTLTFAAGETSKTITVMVRGDAESERDETVMIKLSSPSNATIAEGKNAATGTIMDDDASRLSIKARSATVDEGDPLIFTVTLEPPIDDEQVTVEAVTVGTATAGTDYTAVAAGTLTFAPDETSKTITVVVKGDDESEGDETVVIRLTSPSKAAIAEGKGTAAGTIIDDDTLPRVARDRLARFGRTAASATLDAIARRLNDGVVAAAPSLTVAGHRASFAPEPIAQAAAGTAEPWEESRSRVLTIEELATGSPAEVSFVEGLNVWRASGYNQFEGPVSVSARAI